MPMWNVLFIDVEGDSIDQSAESLGIRVGVGIGGAVALSTLLVTTWSALDAAPVQATTSTVKAARTYTSCERFKARTVTRLGF